MKKIYASRNLTHCDMVRIVLEECGIPCMVKNETLCHTAGASIVGGLPFAWPEVWVHDADLKKAQTCLATSGLSFLEEENGTSSIQ